MSQFDASLYRVELERRVSTIRRIVEAAHVQLSGVVGTDVSREARGLAIVLLFASYENLLTAVCRGLLEHASRLGFGNRQLRRGFRIFAAYHNMKSLRDVSEGRIWREVGFQLIDLVSDNVNCSINCDIFPVDGSFMKRTQVEVFCNLFELGNPASILREVWGRLDTIVNERNGIAHGRLTPEEVGRNYSIDEMRKLIDSWENRWKEFIIHISTRASSNSFFVE